MGAKRFQDLICWQLSRELRQAVRKLIRNPPLSRDFDLCDQLRRATRSATGNIAEGFKCPSHAEFARFLDIAARSLNETEDRLIEAMDEKLLTKEDAALPLNLAKRASVSVTRLIKYLRPEGPNHQRGSSDPRDARRKRPRRQETDSTEEADDPDATQD